MLRELKRIYTDLGKVLDYMDGINTDSLYGHKIESGEFINQYLGDVLSSLQIELVYIHSGIQSDIDSISGSRRLD